MAIFVGNAGRTGCLDAGLIGHELDVRVAQRLAVKLGGSFYQIVEDKSFAATAGGQDEEESETA